MKKPNGYWTKEKALSEALKYSSRNELRKHKRGAYNAIYRLQIQNLAFAHMIKSPKSKWNNKCTLKKEALKYKSKKEFAKAAPTAYCAALKLNIMDEISKHMKPLGHKYKRMLYAFEFPDKSVYVGLTYDYEKRYKQHMERSKIIIKKTKELGHTFIMFNEQYNVDQIGKEEKKLIEIYQRKGWKILNKAKAGSLGGLKRISYTKKQIHSSAKKYHTKKEFYLKHSKMYKYALKMNWWKDVSHHMNPQRKRWTKTSVLKESKKYKTRKQFRKKSAGAYQAVFRLNIANLAFKHMLTKRTIWTKDKIASKALKYSSRKEFEKNDQAAYSAAYRRNLLDKVCKHMM